MRKLVSLACAAVLSSAAHAERFTFEYSATVTSLKELVLVGYQINPLQQATLPTGTIAVGDSVSGRFSFDTAWVPFYQNSDDSLSDASYWRADPVSAAFTQGLQFTSTALASSVYVIDRFAGIGNDSLAFGSNNGNDEYSERVAVVFTDASASLLKSTSLQDAAPILNTANGEFNYAYTTYSPYISVLAVGALTSLRLVSAVPEPSTYAMFAAGLALLAWRRKRG